MADTSKINEILNYYGLKTNIEDTKKWVKQHTDEAIYDASEDIKVYVDDSIKNAETGLKYDKTLNGIYREYNVPITVYKEESGDYKENLCEEYGVCGNHVYYIDIVSKYFYDLWNLEYLKLYNSQNVLVTENAELMNPDGDTYLITDVPINIDESGYYIKYQTEILNKDEIALGIANISKKASENFGDSGNTLFTIGAGIYGNALDIRQNGDIYIQGIWPLKPLAEAINDRVTEAKLPYVYNKNAINYNVNFYGKNNGNNVNVGSEYSIQEGTNNILYGGVTYAHQEGGYNKTGRDGYTIWAHFGHYSHVEGSHNTIQNDYEHAEGYSNVSHYASSDYGNAGNTQHSIGIGSKNAMEVMQNGDLYVYGIGNYQGNNTKVQDNTIKPVQTVITEVNSNVNSLTEALENKADVEHTHQISDVSALTETISDINTEISKKQNTLIPSTGISIDSENRISCTIDIRDLINDRISSTDTTYSSEKIMALIDGISEFFIEIVQTLPGTGDTHTIYFVPAQESGSTDNYYEEYMYIGDNWELIGTTRIDLSNYYTKSETDALLEKKADNPEYEHFHVKALANGGNPITVGISDDWGITEAQYSLDQEIWSAMTTATTVTLSEGESVYIRQITKKADGYRPAKITTTGPISLHGNINDLVDYTEPYQTSLSGRSYIFSSYFSGNNYITDASELILPYTDLSDGCYNSMFYSCTSLTTAPELPAKTLKVYCYNSMFYSCTSLTTAPELPATTLVQSCYGNMFDGCTSLTTAPELPATTLVQYCYNNMFNGCTSLNYVKCLAIYNVSTGCTSGWLANVADSGSFVKPENVIWESGDSGIPVKWIQYRMYNDAELDATLRSKVDKPLYEHFHVKALANGGNTSTVSIADTWGIKEAQYSLDQETWSTMTTATTVTLNEGESVYIRAITLNGPGYRTVHIVPTGKVSLHGNINDLVDYTDPYMDDLGGRTYVLAGCFKNTDAIVDASELILHYTKLSSGCYDHMFSNCTSLVKAPELPATTLVQSCYGDMFDGCTSLTTAPVLPATTLADNCYSCMFQGCTSLTTAPELPATTLVDSCYYRMFGNCTSLTTAPALPATGLTNGCYSSMFQGCTSLNYVKCLAVNSITTANTTDWLTSVADSGKFVKESTTTGWTLDSNSGIPTGWNVVNHYDDTALEGKLSTKAEIWRGTQAQYDALTSYDNNTFYVIIQ